MNPTTVLTRNGEKARATGVGPDLHRLLVHAVMGACGEGAALTGLEVHDIAADGSPTEAHGSVAPLAEHLEADPESLVGGLGSGDRLEHEINRGALLDQLDRCGDVAQHARLRRDLELQAQVVEEMQQSGRRTGPVACGVDADDGVSAAVE
jgi:hypothetical protein